MPTSIIRLAAAVALMLPAVALAAPAAQPEAGDTAWMLTATALVLLMTLPGLSLFYAGLVRVRNVLSVLMQCFTICCVVTILWFVYGYSLAFTEGNAFIGGLSRVLFAGLEVDSVHGSIPESVYAMFQLTFAIITPALVVGSFAERLRFSALLGFTILWFTLVYVPVAHWVWGGGWLSRMGVMDFAGGVVVHITAGVAALVAAIVIGPRRGFPRTAMLPHNLTMTVTGAGLLWVGWFGFNGGSALAANGAAGMAILVTHIAAAAGSLAWMLAEWLRYGKPSVLGIVTGMVAGLGTITPAAGFVGPAGALIIGLAAGVVCFTATNFLERALKIDDSLDVFPVHGVGGVLGTLLVGIFASTRLGLFSGFGFAEGIDSIGTQLAVQAVGVLATISYTVVLTWLILKLLAATTGLRVSDEHETMGLDISQHEERGYDL